MTSRTMLFTSLLYLLVPSKMASQPMTLPRLVSFEITTLQLTTSSFTSFKLSPQQLEATTIMDLSKSSLKSVSANAFQAFPNLNFVNLSTNGLDSFKTKLNSLEYLDLSYNKFQRVNEDLISQFPYLLSINLAGNQIMEVSWTLQGLRMISVDFSYNMKLKDVRISSDCLQELSFKGAMELKNVHLDLTKLSMMDLSATEYEQKASTEHACGLNTVQEYIVVLSEEVHDCKAEEYYGDYDSDEGLGDGTMEAADSEEENSKENTSGSVLKSRKNNYYLSTLQIDVDDVVLTRDEYVIVQTSFFLLVALCLILTVLNCIVFGYYKKLAGL